MARSRMTDEKRMVLTQLLESEMYDVDEYTHDEVLDILAELEKHKYVYCEASRIGCFATYRLTPEGRAHIKKQVNFSKEEYHD